MDFYILANLLGHHSERVKKISASSAGVVQKSCATHATWAVCYFTCLTMYRFYLPTGGLGAVVVYGYIWYYICA